jgi:hypothetical protein
MKKILFISIIAASTGLLGNDLPTNQPSSQQNSRLERSQSLQSFSSFLALAQNCANQSTFLSPRARRDSQEGRPTVIITQIFTDDDSETPSTSSQSVDWRNQAAVLRELANNYGAVTAEFEAEAEAIAKSNAATKNSDERKFELN